jgi:hypothetical protein
LTSKGGRSNSQVLSIVKVLAIDLVFVSICDLLIGGTPYCGKIVAENKENFASNFFSLIGAFSIIQCTLL